MISIAKAFSAEYYVSEGGATASTESGSGTAQGVESYYLDAVAGGEPPGQWAGSGAERLGLAGEVAARDMKVLYGQFEHPDTGAPIGRRADRHRPVEERLAAALAAEPDALPERVEEIRTRIERTDRQAVIGWDVTFSVPKSVTIAHTAAHRAELAAIRSGDQDRADRFGAIRTGIEQAVHDADATMIDYAQKLATARTGGSAGVPTEWVAAPGLTAATFFQHTSRSIDPQLHVHNVFLNRAYCEDGKVRSLDGADLLAQKHALGAIADRTLDEGLTRLGFDVQLRPDMKARELTVIPTQISDLFSSRTRQVTQRVAELAATAEERLGRELTDHELYRLKDAAAASTRASKKGPKDHDGETRAELLERWWAETVAQVGTDLDAVADAIERHLSERLDTVDTTLTPGGVNPDDRVATYSEAAVLSEAVAALGEQKSAWTRADLMLELQLRLPSLGGVAGDEVQKILDRLADQTLTSDLARQVTGLDDLSGTASEQAGAGRGGPLASLKADPFTRPSSYLYASTGTLLAEESLRRAAIERGGHRLDAAAVNAWLDTYASTIGADQRAAVVGLASTDARLAVLVGPAGTGKSFTAGAFANLWQELASTDGDGGGEESGRPGRVIGLTVSKIASQVLRDDGVSTAQVLDGWLKAHDKLADGSTHPADTQWLLGPRDVVLVDEASMVATADLHRIQVLAEAAGARVVLTGDPRQLGAVEAGGVMELLDGHAETYTLSDVRRFEQAWEATASLALRDGDLDALAVYDRHGRLEAHVDSGEALDAAARAAVADRLDGRSVVVVAGTNDEAAHVAGRIRARLVELDLVSEDGVLLGRDGGTAGIGDLVMCRRNDYGIGVTNRGQYLVTGIGDDGSLIVRQLDREAAITAGPDQRPTAQRDQSVIQVPAEYVGTDVQLGYASTVHAAQGITVDSAHVVTDGDLDAAGLYVSMTRGRLRNTAHVVTSPPDVDLHEATGGADARPSARSVLESCLERDSTTRAALVEGERDLARLSSMTLLGGRLETTVRAACRERMDRHLDQLVNDGELSSTARAQLGADDGAETLSRLLRTYEQAGQDPRELLRDAVTAPRGLGDATSIAQVLHHRITAGKPIPHPLTSAGADELSVPADIAPRAADHIALITKKVEARRDTLAEQVAAEQPAWAIDALGPVPADLADPGAQTARAEWLHAAGVVAAHREDTGWSDPARAIGPMPGMARTERRAAYATAWEALGRPAAGLDEAALSDGQLRVRLRARESELAWAPPHADAALRAAELKAEKSRQEAAIVRAQAELKTRAGEHEEASQLLADAALHDQAHAERATSAQALEQAATARAQWAAAAAPTLDAGERAQKEAQRRGLDLADPQPAVTAEEWFTAERQARLADDAHRTITETDLADSPPDDDTKDAATSRNSPTHYGADHAAWAAEDPAESAAPSMWGGHAVVPEDVTSSELEAMAAATALVAARISDRTSQDHTAPDAGTIAPSAGETYDDGRRRRDSAAFDGKALTDQATDSRSGEDDLAAGDD